VPHREPDALLPRLRCGGVLLPGDGGGSAVGVRDGSVVHAELRADRGWVRGGVSTLTRRDRESLEVRHPIRTRPHSRSVERNFRYRTMMASI